MRDTRTLIDRVDDLPDEAEEPELNRIRTRFPVITLTLFGNFPKLTCMSIQKKPVEKCRRLKVWPVLAWRVNATGRSGLRSIHMNWQHLISHLDTG